MRRRIGIAAIVAALLWAFGLSQGVANASVSSAPPATPQIGGSATSGTDGTVEQVRQLTQCGNVMYAVGRFTQVRNPNSTTPIARNNAFAFRAVSPYTVLPWNPNVNGQVDTAACAPDGAILLGGSFTTVGGVAANNLAKVNATTGAQATFGLHPAGRVAHVEVVRDTAGVQHLLVGGYAAPYLRSANPLTGAADNYTMPAISGTYQYPGVAAHTTRVYNMTVSPNGQAVLMTGVFTSVGGQHHEQVFRLNLTPRAATVSGWTPTELFSHCSTHEPFYAQDAAWSTDGSRIFVVSTGLRLYNEPRPPSGQPWGPRTGPCDAAIGYPVTEAPFNGHTWINYTGCDSLFSVAADAETVFIGGHQRWISNNNTCNQVGSGGRAQPGLGEVSPTTGAAQAGPSRGRGLGADDLVRTAAGLWIASDNQANTDSCAGRSSRMGICFLPN
jgi:hypothetical protein